MKLGRAEGGSRQGCPSLWEAVAQRELRLAQNSL